MNKELIASLKIGDRIDCTFQSGGTFQNVIRHENVRGFFLHDGDSYFSPDSAEKIEDLFKCETVAKHGVKMVLVRGGERITLTEHPKFNGRVIRD